MSLLRGQTPARLLHLAWPQGSNRETQGKGLLSTAGFIWLVLQGRWEALGSTGRHWEGASRQQDSGEPQDRGVQAAGSPSLDASEDGGANPVGKGCQWGGSGHCRVAARAGLTWWPSRRPCGRGPLPAGARRSPAPPSRGGPRSTGPQRRWWSLRGVKWGLRGAEYWWLREGEPGPPPSDR